MELHYIYSEMDPVKNGIFIVKLFSQLYPKLKTSKDYIDSLIQIISPYFDLFDKTNKQELTLLINTYFTETLTKIVLNELKEPYHQNSSHQDVIVQVLMTEIIAVSGKSCLDRKRIIIQIYDLYNGISLNKDLRPMFSEWLLPQWIFTGNFSSFQFGKDVAKISKKNIKNMCHQITGISHYEDKMEECIFNLLQGLLIIIQINPTAHEYFEEHLHVKINMANHEDIFFKLLQQILVSIIGIKKIQFINLLYIIKENLLLPQLETILNLYE
jgi:hypothetical protein